MNNVTQKRLPFEALATAALLTLFSSVLLVQLRALFNYYDEGFAVYNAERILNGDAPYKDFWTIYPPGQFYAIALIFKVFGTSLQSARIYDTALRLIITLFAYRIAQQAGSEKLALFAFAAIAVLLGAAGNFGYAAFPCLALCLGAILSVVEYARTGQLKWLALAGTLLGMGSYFRWDIALYAAVALAIVLLVDASGQKASSPGLRHQGNLLFLLGPAAVTTIIAFGYSGLTGSFTAMWEQAVVFPITRLRDIRWLPYPPLIPALFGMADRIDSATAVRELLLWLQFYLPIAVYLTTIGAIGNSIAHRSFVRGVRATAIVSSSIFGILLFAQAVSRNDSIHLLPTTVMAFPCLIWLVSGLSAVPWRARRIALSVLAMTVGAVMIAQPLVLLAATLKINPPWQCYSHLERSSCVLIDSDQASAVEYVRAHTDADEPIFVGNRRHDTIFINDIGFYFLANRRSATTYSELYPGVATTLEVQMSISRELTSRAVRWIVLARSMESREPNVSSVSSGVHYLDDVIQNEYKLDADYGGWSVWTKRER